MRTLTKDLASKIDGSVEIKGWLHKKRLLGGLNFIHLRDRTGLAQVLIEDKTETEKLRGLQIGTVISITGRVVQDERAPNGVELHQPKIQVEVAVTDEPPIEVDKPIDHKNLDTLFEHRVLNLRNLHEQKIFKVRSDMVHRIRQYLRADDFMEIDTPKLLGAATEGGAEVFELDYFGSNATLAQSPQFYKQILVGAFERVFEIGHAYRAEPSATTRHMTEATMLDIELMADSHDEILDYVGNMTMAVLRQTYQQNADELRSLNAPDLKLADKIPRFSVAEIHAMYKKATGVDATHEKDLIPDEEKFIAEYARKQLGSDLVFATEFPIEAAKFYHKVDAEKGVTAWADLIFRGVEIATCPMREHNYQQMIKQMQKAGIDIDAAGYKYYLQAFKYGLPPHGGCGLGIDRLVMKTIGLSNVKEAALFPRDIKRLTP
jgi:nondiscriminating aspartyl-tRNA synthetase